MTVGGADRPLRAPLHQVERVQAGAQLLAHDQVGERVVLGGEALGRGPRSRRARSGRAPGTAPARAVQLGVGERLAACRSQRPTSACGSTAGALDLVTSPRRTPCDPTQRLLEEVGRFEDHDRRCPARPPASALSISFWLSGVLDDHGDRVVRADQVGQQLGAAPAGHQAEEALGQREHRHVAGQRAVVAVQRRARHRRPSPRR